MEKEIKINPDNDRKFMEGLNYPYQTTPKNVNPGKDQEKKESTDTNSGPLEYFTE